MDRFEEAAGPHRIQAQARKQARSLGHILSPFTYHKLGGGFTDAHCLKCDCAVHYGNSADAVLEGTALSLRCDGQGGEYVARKRAAALGHTLSGFERLGLYGGGTSTRCVRCGCAVILENGKPAAGTALSLRCAPEERAVRG